MCVNCFSRADAVALNAGALAVAAVTAWDRLRSALAGVGPEERRAQAWDANATFLRRLGHDPVSLLGPRPTAGAVPALANAKGRTSAVEIGA